MKLETMGVIILFGFFLLGSGIAALVTYRALAGPGASTWSQGWQP